MKGTRNFIAFRKKQKTIKDQQSRMFATQNKYETYTRNFGRSFTVQHIKHKTLQQHFKLLGSDSCGEKFMQFVCFRLNDYGSAPLKYKLLIDELFVILNLRNILL